MQISIIIAAIFSGTIAFIAAIIYFINLLRAGIKPNAATWFIWFFAGFLNVSSYIIVSGSIYQSVLILTNWFGTFFIFGYALFKKRFVKLSNFDIGILIAVILIAFIWYITTSANLANLLMQGIFIASVLPTINNLLKKTGSEDVLPWILWSSAAFFTFYIAIVNFENNFVPLIYPFLGIVLHGLVAIMAYKPENKIEQ